jgi:D-alanine-D-alanine ligase
MRKLRILALVHGDLVPPEDLGAVDLATAEWKTEYDVVTTLRQLGHTVHPLGVHSDLSVIREAIEAFKPHIAFNLLEAFDEVGVFDQNVVGYLELKRMPYTGCNPRGLLLARDKAISKKLLHFHRIPVPDFAVFHMGQSIRRPKRLGFPLIVKSRTQEASIGISQASVVEDDEKLRERVAFIHRSIGTDAIAERYIEGRELYVGVLGNLRLQVLPTWELLFTNMPEDAHRIATERVKWNPKYQEKRGIKTEQAKDLPEGLPARIRHLVKRVYRILEISGYARIDLRLDADGRVYVLEANPNPQLAYGEDLAESAERAKIPYKKLLQRILNLGLRWQSDRLG